MFHLNEQLENEEFLENFGNYRSDSIGGVATKQLKILFSSRDIKEIHNLFKTQRDRFETILQSKLPLEILDSPKPKQIEISTNPPKIDSETNHDTRPVGESVIIPPVTVEEKETGREQKPIKPTPPGEKEGDPLKADKGNYFEMNLGGGTPVKRLKFEDLIVSTEDKPRALSRSEFRNKFKLKRLQAKNWYAPAYRFVLKRIKKK